MSAALVWWMVGCGSAPQHAAPTVEAPPPPPVPAEAPSAPPATPPTTWLDGAPTGTDAVETRGATSLRVLAHQPDMDPLHRLRLERAGAAPVELVAYRPWALSGDGKWLLLADAPCPGTSQAPDPMCVAANPGRPGACPPPALEFGVRVWDVAAAACWTVGAFPGDVSGIAWSPDDAHVAWMEDDGGDVRVVLATPGTRTVRATADGLHQACGSACVAEPVRWAAAGVLEVPADGGAHRYDAHLARLP